jgi:hypothetical protein
MTRIWSGITNEVQGIFFECFRHPKSGEEPKKKYAASGALLPSGAALICVLQLPEPARWHHHPHV